MTAAAGRLRLATRVTSSLPLAAIGVAIVLAVPGLLGWAGATGVGILPIDPQSVDPLDAALAIVALSAIGIGLVRRKRLARVVAAATFGCSIVGQALTLHHPLAAALAAACLVALLLDGRRYRAATDRHAWPIVVAAMFLALGVLAIGSIVFDALSDPTPGGAVAAIGAWLASWLDFVDPNGVVVSPGRLTAAFDGLELVARLAVVVAALAVLRADPLRPAPEVVGMLRLAASRYACGPLTPFQLAPDKLLYAPLSGSGVVAYGLAGRTAVVLGEPLGDGPDRWRAFEMFVERCETGDVSVGVYQATDLGRDHLRAMGFRTFLVGGEAVVDLPTFGLAGPGRANLRHTVARARRAGIRVRWFPGGLSETMRRELGPGLADVDADWRRHRGPRLRFTIGEFDVPALDREGVAVALDGDVRPVAFATFRRTGPTEWVLDLMRRRADAAPGALETCLVDAAIEMRAEGASVLSLGLAPLAGLDARHGPPEERLLALVARVVRPLYDIDGLAFFKRKFEPRWVARHAAVRGRLAALPFVAALLWLHLRT